MIDTINKSFRGHKIFLRNTKEETMARFDFDTKILTEWTSPNAPVEAYYELGLMYSAGRSVEVDCISAHKWFNIAATRGHPQAAHRRNELALEMTSAEVAKAQRAAREWLHTQRAD
jgi:uncharacterized protein